MDISRSKIFFHFVEVPDVVQAATFLFTRYQKLTGPYQKLPFTGPYLCLVSKI